jgi:hypothetical protein
MDNIRVISDAESSTEIISVYSLLSSLSSSPDDTIVQIAYYILMQETEKILPHTIQSEAQLYATVLCYYLQTKTINPWDIIG